MLSMLGVLIAGYLSYTDAFGIVPACGSGGGCAVVHTSEYSRLLGIPVFHLGLIGYLILVVTSWLHGERWRLVSVAVAVVGLTLSAYLQYRSLVTLQATCIWCMASAATMLALTIVTITRYALTDETSTRR